MIKGISLASAACFVWGLIFVVPLFMDGFSSFEVTLGRYAIYGILSSFIFLRAWSKGSCRYPMSIWRQAIVFSLAATFGYYSFVVMSVRYSTPDICALILGISPITIALYGNLKEKETSYRSLLLPAVFILLGLSIINIPHILSSPSPSSYLFGLFSALLALISWSWYVVANARFLRQNIEVKSSDWSTLLGVASIFWAFIFGAFFMIFFEDQINLKKCCNFDPNFWRFLGGSLILGILCSWVGAFLWNRASLHLPVSLAGHLTLLETIFGASFAYLINRHFPSWLEAIGIVLLLAAVLQGVRRFAKAASSSSTTLPSE